MKPFNPGPTKWLAFIQDQLEKQSMPMTALALIADIPYHTVRSMFDNQHAPKVTTLEKMLRALGYTLTIEASALPPDMQERREKYIHRAQVGRRRKMLPGELVDTDLEL